MSIIFFFSVIMLCKIVLVSVLSLVSGQNYQYISRQPAFYYADVAPAQAVGVAVVPVVNPVVGFISIFKICLVLYDFYYSTG